MASENYYRDKLEPTYEKVKKKVREMILNENPEEVTISCDGWSENHNHYLGINAHCIDQNFNRQKFHLECIKYGFVKSLWLILA